MPAHSLPDGRTVLGFRLPPGVELAPRAVPVQALPPDRESGSCLPTIRPFPSCRRSEQEWSPGYRVTIGGAPGPRDSWGNVLRTLNRIDVGRQFPQE